MKIAITGAVGDFHVWAMLDDPDFNHDPTERGESFVIGSGETIAEALDAARQSLAKASGDVEVMLHDAGENPNPSIEELVR